MEARAEMRFFHDLSIRSKLTLIIMAVSSFALLLACIAFIRYDLYTFRLTKLNDVSTLAEIIGSNATGALSFHDADNANEILSGLRAKKQISAACIYAKDGRLFAKYLRRDTQGGFAPPPPQEDGSYFENGELTVFRKIMLTGESIGTVYIRYDLSEMRERQNRYTLLLVFVALSSLLVAFLLSSRLQRSISEPIRDLART